MSELENNKRPNRDFSKFDDMSSEALNEILKHDLELNNEESDTEMIFYILEVLEKREEYSDIDTESSWETFKSNYLSEEDKPDGKNPNVVELPKRTGRKVLRFAVSLAAVIALLFILAVTASAEGRDVFDSIATWTEETFRFKSSGSSSQSAVVHNTKEIPDELSEFAELLDENGLDSQSLLPGYLPEGYEILKMNTINMAHYVEYLCALQNDDKYIKIAISDYFDDVYTEIHEKDAGDPEEYKFNSVMHYIMTNCGIYCATWMNNNIKCSLSGFASKDEIIATINSIYGE